MIAGQHFTYQAWFDGSIQPINPGGTAAWGCIIRSSDEEIYRANGVVGTGPLMSNNVAEYAGVAAALEYLDGKSGTLLVSGDSQMVCSQMNKLWGGSRSARQWSHRPGRLYWPYFEKARTLALKRKELILFRWIPREQNWKCDELSRLAYSEIVTEGRQFGSRL
jgi:ribonuclease HI